MYSVRFSPDGQHLATAGMDTNIFLWDVYGDCDNYALLQGHKNAVLEVCWNFDGSEIVSAGADKNVIVWDGAVGSIDCLICVIITTNNVAGPYEAQTKGSFLVREWCGLLEGERQPCG